MDITSIPALFNSRAILRDTLGGRAAVRSAMHPRGGGGGGGGDGGGAAAALESHKQYTRTERQDFRVRVLLAAPNTCMHACMCTYISIRGSFPRKAPAERGEPQDHEAPHVFYKK